MHVLYPEVGPRIWRTPTTNVGSNSWIGESGEEAILAPTTVEYLTGVEGGVTLSNHVFDRFGVGRPGYIDLDDEGVTVVTMRASMWWTGHSLFDAVAPAHSASGEFHVTTFMQFYLQGDLFNSVPGLFGGTGYWDSNHPTNTLFVPAVGELMIWDGYADIDINDDLDDSDSDPGYMTITPATVGLEGFKTGWFRMTCNQNTNAVTIELSLDNNGTPVGWTTVGSDIFTEPFSGGPFNSYVEFNHWWARGEPSEQAAYTVHDFKIEVDGVFQYGWTAADIAAHNIPIGSTSWPIQDQNISPSTIIDIPNGRVSLAAHPGVYLPHKGDYKWEMIAYYTPAGGGTGWAPLWASGPVLANPCILYAAFDEPGWVRRITGIQPTDFYGLDPFYQPVTAATNGEGKFPAGFCYGVCDLADPLVGATFWSNGDFVQDVPVV